jgi:hypothetical protein
VSGAAWAGVAVASLTLGWAITAFMLARALRAERERGTITAQLAAVVRDLDRITQDKDKVHAAILDQIREDRQQRREDLKVTDQRLRWLETHLWSARQRGQLG